MVVTIIGHILKPHVEHEVHTNRYLALGLIVLRYCNQLVRLLILVWRTKQERERKI